MSIIIADLDDLIISFLELQDAVSLMKINVNYHNKIKCMKLICEWNSLKYNRDTIDVIFHNACSKNYLTYTKSLIFRYHLKIDIHANNEGAFRWSCCDGHIDVAKFLIDLGENHGYYKINIHAHNEYAFRWSCINGHIDVAKFLIDLGENYGYNKIDIHADNDYAFRQSCYNEHIEVANFLIDLGENHGYDKINIHEFNY
jgi:ankyrin repeat protein